MRRSKPISILAGYALIVLVIFISQVCGQAKQEDGLDPDGKRIEKLIASFAQNPRLIREKAKRHLFAFGERAVPYLQKHLSSANERIRAHCLDALLLISEEHKEAAFEALIDSSTYVRHMALDILVSNKFPESVDRILFSVENTYQNRDRVSASDDKLKEEMALNAIVRIGDKAESALIRGLGSKSEHVRRVSSHASGRLVIRSAQEHLIELLENDMEHHSVQTWSAFALVMICRYKPALKHLEDVSKSTDADEVIEAIKAMGELGDKSNVKAILTHLANPNRQVRIQAAQALGELKANEAVHSLLLCLNDANVVVQITAMIALGEIGSKKALWPIICKWGTLYTDKDVYRYLRNSAHDALVKISGENHGSKVSAWKKWYLDKARLKRGRELIARLKGCYESLLGESWFIVKSEKKHVGFLSIHVQRAPKDANAVYRLNVIRFRLNFSIMHSQSFLRK
jgi:HEAT repeat protein